MPDGYCAALQQTMWSRELAQPVCDDSCVVALDDILVGVAATLASGAITGTAKAAWGRFKQLIVERSPEGKRAKAWLDLLEADPSEELARQIAERLNDLNVGSDPMVQRAAQDVGAQIAIGEGATNAIIGVNYGPVGGVHVHIASETALALRKTGLAAYRVVNDSHGVIVVSEISSERSTMPVTIRDALPRALGPGDHISLIVEPRMGAGRLSVRVSFTQDGRLGVRVLSTGG